MDARRDEAMSIDAISRDKSQRDQLNGLRDGEMALSLRIARRDVTGWHDQALSPKHLQSAYAHE